MLVSLITVTYNRANTLRHTIESVLSQTYPNIEHIIIDGLSTDDTKAVVRSYEKQYGDKLRFLSEADSGAYDALNKGIRMAKGDIVGMLHSDDFFTSTDVIAAIVDHFNNTGADIVYGDVHYVKDYNNPKPVRYYSSKNFAPWQMYIGLMPAHPSLYVRREVMLRHDLYATNYKIAADFEYLLRIISKERISMAYLPKDCVTMCVGGLSTSGIKTHMRIYREHLKAYKTNRMWLPILLDPLRYPYRIYEIFKWKLQNKRR